MRALPIMVSLLVALAIVPAAARSMPPLGRLIAPRDSGGGMPTVDRGASFTIACAEISHFARDVRVVLSLAVAPGDKPAGYAAVLATEQRIGHGAVRVRMPDMDDIANRVVDVRVYVMDADGAAKSCDAGKLRIG